MELVVYQDGRLPFGWDDNASDSLVFKERSNTLIGQCLQSQPPRHLIADSKLYTKAKAKPLAQHPFITQIAKTIKLVLSAIFQAWEVTAGVQSQIGDRTIRKGIYGHLFRVKMRIYIEQKVLRLNRPEPNFK